MQQPINGYFQDEENYWVAKLACGHNPPLVTRPVVLTQAGQNGKFQGFRVEHGDLVWGDYDLCFPVADLYQGRV